MESAISVLGSIASIGGAIWAFVHAGKARSSAEVAVQMRDELVNRREIVEVSHVHNETRRILIVISKVGPSCNPKLIKGVNCSDIAREVEEYVRFLLEQSEHFARHFENDARALCDVLRADIEALSEAVSFEDKKKHGKSIYYKIQSFMPTVKRLSDEKREMSAD